MKTLYFDCFSGAGGDMIVAALIDAGASLDHVAADLAGLSVSGFRVRADKVTKQGFAATRFRVQIDPSCPQPSRHLADIEALLADSELPDRVRDRALATFGRLADAEAEAHGVGRDAIHFHEVGAVDAIVDVVAAMLAIEALAPDRIFCSPLPTGSGTVKCAHGVMPVPAPATAILVRGVPLVECDEPGELLTPTAAAILTTVCDRFGLMPSMTIERIGLGAGTRDGAGRPNLLRVMLGSTVDQAETDEVIVLETNVDDASPEWLGYCLERLLDEGALDAYSVPIHMKKSRPGVVLTAICERVRADAVEAIIFAETGTFGIRRTTAGRSKLGRRHETVQTPYGPIRVKVGLRAGQTTTAAAEFADCADAAKKHNVPVRVVMAAAISAWQGSA